MPFPRTPSVPVTTLVGVVVATVAPAGNRRLTALLNLCAVDARLYLRPVSLFVVGPVLVVATHACRVGAHALIARLLILVGLYVVAC